MAQIQNPDSLKSLKKLKNKKKEMKGTWFVFVFLCWLMSNKNLISNVLFPALKSSLGLN